MNCFLRLARVAPAFLAALGAAALAQVPPKAPAPYATPAPPSQGSKVIIKSVDGSGRVTYSDRDLGVGGTRFEVRSYGTSSQPLSPAPTPTEDQKGNKAGSNSLVDWAKNQQAKIDEANKATEESNARIAKENCERARQQLATLSAGRRVTKVNDRGEPVYLGDEEIAAEKTRVEADIAKTCNK